MGGNIPSLLRALSLKPFAAQCEGYRIEAWRKHHVGSRVHWWVACEKHEAEVFYVYHSLSNGEISGGVITGFPTIFEALAWCHSTREGSEVKSITEMAREMDGIQRKLDAHRAKREPDANKMTPVFRQGYGAYTRFYAGTLCGGHHSWWCVADHVNAAGYSLLWYEVHRSRVMNYWGGIYKPTHDRYEKKLEIKRTRWSASKNRETMISLAKRRAERNKIDHDDRWNKRDGAELDRAHREKTSEFSVMKKKRGARHRVMRRKRKARGR